MEGMGAAPQISVLRLEAAGWRAELVKGTYSRLRQRSLELSCRPPDGDPGCLSSRDRNIQIDDQFHAY
nr:hypothetical protein CFP56_07915 [Quercus suber]